MKRRNAIILFITFIIVFVLVIVIRAHASINNANKHITYTVQQGDTLWGIAKRYGKHTDIREDIYDIQQLNKCNADIQPGQELLIPTK